MNFDWSLRYEIPCVALLDCVIGWVHCLIGRDQKLSRFDIVIIAIALKRYWKLWHSRTYYRMNI